MNPQDVGRIFFHDLRDCAGVRSMLVLSGPIGIINYGVEKWRKSSGIPKKMYRLFCLQVVKKKVTDAFGIEGSKLVKMDAKAGIFIFSSLLPSLFGHWILLASTSG